MYELTMDGLTNLYQKLNPGGYLIVDDYGAVPACRQAVHDYRDAQSINAEICSVDWTGFIGGAPADLTMTQPVPVE